MSPKKNIEKINLEEFQNYRYSPILPVRDLKDLDGNDMAKNFPFWRRNNLLPFIPKGSWNLEISLIQLIWLRILEHLRIFSYRIEDTQKVADYFFKDAFFAELPEKILLHKKKDLLKRLNAGTIDQHEQLLLLEIQRILDTPLKLYSLKFEINYLSQLLTWYLDNRQETGILIFQGGEVAEKKGKTISSHLKGNLNIKRPHIYISINYLMEEFIDEKELDLIVDPQVLNENEQLVLQEIRNKNLKRLEIKMENGRIQRIDSSFEKIITNEEARQLRKKLALKEYEEITISTRDQKSISFKKTKKNILPSD